MSRILLTWELGMNLGHLARLLPVASELKARGHTVLVAVREVPAAAAMFGPGIEFIPAPVAHRGLPRQTEMSSYADILLAQGWRDPRVLATLINSWLEILRLFRPAAVVHAHSPTAQLATRIEQIPSVLLANGFELPPSTVPLPAFPDVSWATIEQAAKSEKFAIDSYNHIRARCGGQKLEALRDLFDCESRLLTTWSELDSFGPRSDAKYVGPLFGRLLGEKVEWPVRDGEHAKVFAYLRPDTPHVSAILGALKTSTASVICVAPGFDRAVIESLRSERFICTSRLVDLDPLVNTASLCISHGGEVTMARFLMAGVPQLISPSHVEGTLAARKVAALGAGVALGSDATQRSIDASIGDLLNQPTFRTCAQRFSSQHREFNIDQAVASVVAEIERVSS